MNTTPDPKLYRPNVGLALFHKNGLVFLGKRVATEGPYQWQMPQGGVDRGEKVEDAAYRELEEEIGVRSAHVELLEEILRGKDEDSLQGSDTFKSVSKFYPSKSSSISFQRPSRICLLSFSTVSQSWSTFQE